MQPSNHDSSIYITVMSDSSSERYPANSAARFIVDLAQYITLEGTWQIALTEIHISNNWYDITEDCSMDIAFECLDKCVFKSVHSTPNPEHDSSEDSDDCEDSDDELDEEHHFTVNFKRNSFPSVNHLCLYLNHEIYIQMPNDCKDVAYQTSDQSKPFIDFQTDLLFGTTRIISIGGVNVSVKFNKFKDIFSILSLDLSNDDSIDLPIEGNRRASLTAGNLGLFVLCNLVHFQSVGDSQMRLLRFISIKACDRREDRHSHYFQKPYYISVCSSSFQTIDIELRKDNNQPISFPLGSKIIAVLHLRRKLVI